MDLSRFNTRTKLIGSAIMGVGFVLLVAAVGLFHLRQINQGVEVIYLDQTLPIKTLGTAHKTLYELHGNLMTYVMLPENRSEIRETLKRNMDAINAFLGEYETGKVPPDAVQALTNFKIYWSSYQRAVLEAMTLTDSGNRAVVYDSLKGGSLAQNQRLVSQSFDELVRANEAVAEGVYQASGRTYRSAAMVLILASVLAAGLSLAASLTLSLHITRPLELVTNHLRKIAQGGLQTDFAQMEKIAGLTKRKDEAGALAAGLLETQAYLEDVSAVAQALGEGNLAVQVQPKGEEDLLGNTLRQMIERLQGLIGQFANSALTVSKASDELSGAADQSGQASAQIAMTIQQVAQGISQQATAVSQTSSSIHQMTRAIDGVARGAQEQAAAVGRAAKVVNQITQAIREIRVSAEQQVLTSGRAVETSQNTARVVEDTARGMERIRKVVDMSAQKVQEMGNRSRQIGLILETIDDIAAKTNILAINAAIEAAHAEVQSKKMTEIMLDRMMTAQCRIINHLLLSGWDKRPLSDWQKLGEIAQLDMVLATDEDGVVVLSNDSKLIGWKFPTDPKEQAYPFRQLIHQKDGVVCQESQKRSFDDEVYKFVGVSRADRPGIVQIGFNVSSLKNFELRINGFAVVAQEVYQLAEQARQATREIAGLIREIQKAVEEAVRSMAESGREVQQGVGLADQSRQALDELLRASQGGLQSGEEIARATLKIDRLAEELASAMDSVSAIVEENTAATEQMAAGSGEVSEAIENIASISEQNSAAVEEVSASTEEMSAQVEEVSRSANLLAELAQTLIQMVANFQTDNGRDTSLRFQLVRQAHSAWLRRLRIARMENRLNNYGVVTHEQCSLGRWYYGAGKQHYGSLPQFEALERVHIRFHQLTRQAVETFQNGHRQEFESTAREVEAVTAEFLGALDRLEAAIQAAGKSLN
ncbi:MAG: methyl-accepting chemotaxis protein [Bellilinea sp.]